MSSSNSTDEAPQQRALREKEAEVRHLRQRCAQLSQQLQAALGSTDKRRGARRQHHPLSPHAVNVRECEIPNSSSGSGGRPKRTIAAQRERIGRTASIATRRVLDGLVARDAAAGGGSSGNSGGRVPSTIQRILDMFQNPEQHMDYLNSPVFAKDLLKLCKACRHLFEAEPRVVFLQSPCYVFGDIHGNLEDLHFFSDNIWRLGMSLTAGNFLFLGDYVDRGLSCLETVAYLLAMKQQLPTKVYLLRGNHETRDVNGWEEHYGERSFIWQCRSRFGDDLGYRLWEACNAVFDRMPLAAVLDQDIFCVHGGIPRPAPPPGGHPATTRIQDILTVPKVAGINPPYEHEDDNYQQVASDCIWSDPASEEQEMTSVDPDTGFGESLRGGGAICFGSKAVTSFLQEQDFSYIMRAHEAHADGVAISKGARVFTVFSTSQDHNQGSHAMAGCMLVDNEKLQVINRSPAYKNQYVHRRDSVSLAALSETEIQKRVRLGLVTHAPPGVRVQDADAEMEDWRDIEDDDDDDDDDADGNAKEEGIDSDDEEDFVIDPKRRSSVDLDHMSVNMHDQECEHGSVQAAAAAAAAAFAMADFEPNKRQRSRKPMVASISEDVAAEDEEIATVDGEEAEEME